MRTARRVEPRRVGDRDVHFEPVQGAHVAEPHVHLDAALPGAALRERYPARLTVDRPHAQPDGGQQQGHDTAATAEVDGRSAGPAAQREVSEHVDLDAEAVAMAGLVDPQTGRGCLARERRDVGRAHEAPMSVRQEAPSKRTSRVPW
jgi:hypothetical protein